MKYEDILHTFDQWDKQMQMSVRIIAGGGAALTLLRIKPFTQELDFLVPVQEEYTFLNNFLEKIGYERKDGKLYCQDCPEICYRFWPGNRIFNTELLEPPLKESKHTKIKKWAHIYLGVLNLMDLIVTQLFRGNKADVGDCIAVFKTWQVDAEALLERYAKASSADPHPAQKMQQFMTFVEELVSYHLVPDDFVEKVAHHQKFPE